MFICIPEDIWNLHDRKMWAHAYLRKQHWAAVTNTPDKRFICPKCMPNKRYLEETVP